MFRTLRARAGVLLMSRLPLRVQAQSYQNVIPVQRVRIKRPYMRPRMLLTNVLATVILYQVFTRSVLGSLDRLADEMEKNMDEETKKELEDSNEPLFIPFPLTTKQVKPRPYKGSDPEWQEYIKFSRNPALGKLVRDELAAYIKYACERSPMLTMRCGKEIKLRRYWLDVDFPTHPPPEFERSGIEIADDYIAWTTMPVDSLTVFRIRQALWPSALTQSLWSWSKVLITGGSDRKALGLPPIQPQKPLPVGEDLKRPSSNESEKTQDITKAGLSPGRSLNAEELAQLREKTNRKLDEANQSLKELQQKESTSNSVALTKSRNHPSSNPPTNKANIDTEDPYLSSIRNQTLRAYIAFRTKLAQTWRPARAYPPRGSIFVSGLVELDTPRAWLVIDVRAAWDPKTKTYDPRSMILTLRRLQMKKQAPLGGR